MKKVRLKSIESLLGKSLLLSALALSPAALQAENVFVTGWFGTSSTADKMPCPPSCVTGFATIGASGFSASQVSPVPIIPNNARRINYGNAVGATWSVTPTDVTLTPTAPAGSPSYTFTTLQNTGVYKIYLTKGQDNNASTNIIVELTATENGSPAMLADSNGLASSAIQLDMFQKGKPNHVWVHVGYITNTTPSPTITLTHISGEINDTDGTHNNAQRWYTDAIRFEYLDACVGVANQVGVSGPLVQGQAFVNVTDVVDGATNVTVYADNLVIGETNFASGFSAGALTVPTTALAKGQRITAGQTKNGCTSIVPTTGPVVGSGPNAALKAFLSCWKVSGLTGPIGANTTNTLSENYFLKATGFISGFGTAPIGGADLIPGECWQTVTFDHTLDFSLTANGSSTAPNTDPYCALDGLLFSIASDESGPYELYIDQIMNGDTVIENFEGKPIGSAVLFAAPAAATAPNPVSTYVGAPNSSAVSQDNAFDGTNACKIQWQWADGSDIRWARVPANMTNSSKFYPQLDTSKPITIRYLLLPAGSTTNKLSLPTVPTNQSKSVGQNVTFSVAAAGEGPFTYQWQFAGSDLPGETNSSYTKNNVQVADSGVYSVVVTGATCSTTQSATLTVSDVVEPPTLQFSVSGNQITFTWTGSFTLQSRDSVDSGTWTDVSASSGHQELLNAGTTKFYRLRQ